MEAKSVTAIRLVTMAITAFTSLSLFAAPPLPPVYKPEIMITGMNTEIKFQSTQPRKLDGTYYGLAQLGVNSWEHEFEIRNFGNADLVLSSPVTLTGPNASDFSVTEQPSAVTISPGQRTSFKILFTPSFAGNAYATVSLENNDNDEGIYTFDIRGDGVTQALTGPNLQCDLVFYKKYKCKGLPLLFCKMNGRVIVSNAATNYDLNLATVRIYVVEGDVLTDEKFLIGEFPIKKLKSYKPGKPLKLKKKKFSGWVPPNFTHIYAEVVPQDGSEDIDYTDNRTKDVYGLY